ncbi:MAG: hypothetical protein GWN30_16570 [Gammaproteobacteria bacterium]|nr:hypothetical protein [Gammaproteobacteria bacterium]
MTTLQHYPNLDILPVEKICLHEHHDPQRTLPLMARIRASGILYNPPLVIPVENTDGRHMVLDGANRVTSMKEIGLPHLLVQIVDRQSPGLSLKTWNHVLWKIGSDRLLEEIAGIDKISIEPILEPKFDDQTLALITMPDHRHFSLKTQTPDMRSDAINQLVQMYSQLSRYDRTMIEDIDHLEGFYNQLAGLVIYPPFKISDVVQFCQDDRFLPAGITRFIVSPRALRVNYPLEKLSSDQPLEEKRNHLRTFIQERMDKKGVRIYTETTVLYDE